VKAGPNGKVTAAPGSVEAAEGQQARVAAPIEGFITTPTDTGPETAEAAAAETRDDQWAVRHTTDCVTKISDSLLARPSRKRQRLPVQLWGQLLRPCRVLGAATDSCSLQRRCAAAIDADADPQRVLVLEWVDPPWGAGHWIPDMIKRAGGEPVLGHKGGHAEVTMWDAVREEAPTIVVVAPCGYHLAKATEPCSPSWRPHRPVGTTRSGPSTPTPMSCAPDPVSSTASSCSPGSSPGRSGTRLTRTRSPGSADPANQALIGDGRVRTRG
jgi:hypothetical protein